MLRCCQFLVSASNVVCGGWVLRLILCTQEGIVFSLFHTPEKCSDYYDMRRHISCNLVTPPSSSASAYVMFSSMCVVAVIFPVQPWIWLIQTVYNMLPLVRLALVLVKNITHGNYYGIVSG